LLFSLVSFKAGLKGDDKPQAAKALSGLVEAAKPVRPSVEESISKDSRPYRDKRKDTVRGTCEHGEGLTLLA